MSSNDPSKDTVRVRVVLEASDLASDWVKEVRRGVVPALAVVEALSRGGWGMSGSVNGCVMRGCMLELGLGRGFILLFYSGDRLTHL